MFIHCLHIIWLPSHTKSLSTGKESVVGADDVGPAVHLVVSPPEALLVKGGSADQELFEGAAIDLRHAVQLPVVLQRDAHHLAELLLGAVPGRAGRLLGLPSVGPHDGANQPSDQVVFEGNVTLRDDVLLLGHLFAVIFDHIPPLITIGVALAPLTILAKLL